ncbi:MAG: DUF255 domain-containing protein, partial [Bacteroidota bacterium]
VTGRGGWPLNIIALPDGKPVYAGTYFPKREWSYLLREMASIHHGQPSELIRQAEDIHRRMQQMEEKPGRKKGGFEEGTPLKINIINLKSKFDLRYGGLLGAPKFPMPSMVDFCLHYALFSGDEKTRSWFFLTLDKMACGGIYDQIGGGFSRYSTDERWHVPHFEKMLYDNAQLVSLYSKGFSLTGKSLYREVVYNTLEFIHRELTSKEGLFFSSIDADSEGKEGAFYSWKESEIEQLLSPDHKLFLEHFKISEEGNWEHGENVLWDPQEKEITLQIRNQSAKLLSAREKRIRPALDNKIITSWNAMMITGFIDAYRVFGEVSFLLKGIHSAEFLFTNVMEEGGKLRRLANSQREVPGFLDDYAFMIRTCIDLYQVTFRPEWMNRAKILVEYTLDHFHDDHSGLFFYSSSEDPALIDRRMELSDNVIPASNSVMAHNLFILGHLLDMGKWIRLAEGMVQNMMEKISSDPSFYAHWADLQLFITNKPYQISIAGEDWENFLKKLLPEYLPGVILSGGTEENLEILKGKSVPGKTLIYICRDKVCFEPFGTVEEALGFLKSEIEHG